MGECVHLIVGRKDGMKYNVRYIHVFVTVGMSVK